MPKEIRNPKTAALLDCGGRAQRRHRFSPGRQQSESGVALHFPPQSKMSSFEFSTHQFL